MITTREGYARLVREHQDMLYRHARGMGLDHDTALDIVQDALVRGYQHIAECRDELHFRAWIGRIGRNLCLDHLKNVRRLSTPLSQLAQAENIRDERANAEIGVTLYQALDRLPTSLREAFLLKHDAGYSYDEIAELTDASASAAKMRVHRARETLRELLDVTIGAA